VVQLIGPGALADRQAGFSGRDSRLCLGDGETRILELDRQLGVQHRLGRDISGLGSTSHQSSRPGSQRHRGPGAPTPALRRLGQLLRGSRGAFSARFPGAARPLDPHRSTRERCRARGSFVPFVASPLPAITPETSEDYYLALPLADAFGSRARAQPWPALQDRQGQADGRMALVESDRKRLHPLLRPVLFVIIFFFFFFISFLKHSKYCN
jgi:hypothetical protein